MSKSLTINAPQIVQTRNTLNAVPSGSTAEPDYSVKFVPQDLTEAQQAQARQNIGAAAAGESGGAAPEIDQYFTIYTVGYTTMSAEAGNINEVWMDGYKRSAVEGSYSLNAGSVVRVDASRDIKFNFSNTTDEIWIWVPKGLILVEPIYGTRPNVNLVYYNMSASAQTMNFGGTLWLMTNRLFNTIFDNNVHIVFNDTETFNANGVTIETSATNINGYTYVSVYKKHELRTAVGDTAFDNLRQKGGSYGYLVQEGYRLVRKELSCVVDDCLQLTYSNIGSSVIRIMKNDVGTYGCGMSIDYMYQGSKPCHYRYVSDVSDLKEGEYCWNYGDSWTICYKPYSTGVASNTTLYIKLHDYNNTWSRHNCTSMCNGIVFPSRNPLPSADDGHTMWYCDFSKLNNTVIFPEWKNGTYNGDGSLTVQKVVCLNKSLTSANYVNSSTEYVFTITSLPGSVFNAVQNSNVTKVWLPRATYELAIVDANWSTYASKLFPYDKLTFGPNNYVMPVDQVQSDWNQSDTTAVDYIKNKPEISNRNLILSQLENKNTVKVVIDGGSTVTVTAKWREAGYLYVKATNSITEYTTTSNVNITLYPGFNYFIAKNSESTANAITTINFPNTFTNKAWVYNNMQANDRLGTCTVGQQVYQVSDNNGMTQQNDDHVAGMILYSLQDAYGWPWVTGQRNPHGIVWANRDLPETLTGFTVPFLNNLYIIRSKYDELVTKLNASYTTAEVEDILSKVTVWDYVTQIEGRIYFNTLPTLPLTMTDANGNTIDGDFVAQNITITPAV